MPTAKQKKAFDKTLENTGNVTKAMREVGYSENTIHKPQNLTESDGWKELMDEHISEQKLAKVHNEGLEATKCEKAIDGMVTIPDHVTRHKFMDTGYKIRGKIVKEDSSVPAVQVNVQVNNNQASQLADEYEEKLKKQLDD